MMDELELKNFLYDHMKEICHYSQMQVFATSSYQKKYFQLQIDEAVDTIINSIMNRGVMGSNLHSQTMQLENDVTESQPSEEQVPLREITLEELIESDGTNGKPAYVAVNGIVYDVTNAIRWSGGRHFGVYPGRDLTEDFMNCHNGVYEILNILPKIGVLIR